MTGMQSINLTDHFLIAMPAMADSIFSRSLVYVCEHNAQGALGIVVNRTLDMSLSMLFERVSLPLEVPTLEHLPIHYGGPVQTDRGFVLHQPAGPWQSTLPVNERVGLTSSRDILESIGTAAKPADFIVALGYSGWSAGQLEDELAQNAWLTVPASPEILFDVPLEERLPAAMQSLGVSFAHLAEEAGHA